MMVFRPAALLVPLLVAGCLETGPTVDPSSPALDAAAQREISFGECAIYFAAAASLESQERRVPGRLTRGCPAEASSSAANITPMVSPPPMMSGYPSALDSRLRQRGIPDDLADEIARSKAFWDLVARRDSLLAGF